MKSRNIESLLKRILIFLGIMVLVFIFSIFGSLFVLMYLYDNSIITDTYPKHIFGYSLIIYIIFFAAILSLILYFFSHRKSWNWVFHPFTILMAALATLIIQILSTYMTGIHDAIAAGFDKYDLYPEELVETACTYLFDSILISFAIFAALIAFFRSVKIPKISFINNNPVQPNKDIR